MDEKLKIAVYKDNLSTGRGADRAVRNFAVALEERGYDVTLFEKAELAARLEEKFDVFVATGSNEAVDLMRLGWFERQDRARSVLQLHLAPRGFFKWRHPFRNRLVRKAFAKFDAVQLLCSDYVGEFRRLAKRPELAVIGNWTERPCGEAKGDKTILYPAAAFTKVKNQELLIRAFASLAKDFPGWKLRLLGKDSTKYGRKCKKLAEKLDLGERVEFAGFTADLDGEYSRASFVAFPSTLEGFPLAILEAAGYNLAAVAIDALPGVRDIVVDGTTGLVSEPSVKGYAKALARLMEDEALRKSLGEGAKKRRLEEYCREALLDKWEKLLKPE